MLNEINKLTPKDGERYIVIENGEFTKVVLSFEDYKKLVGDTDSQPPLDFPTIPESMEPEDLNNIEDEQEKAEEKPEKEVTLEDLPF